MFRTPGGQPFVWLRYEADETMTPERVKTLRAKYSSEAYWRREMLIQADALAGTRVYPDFDPGMHVIRDEDVPKRGCIYFSIDPHPRTPHAMLWVLIDRWSDWYVYREMWPSIAYPTDRRWRRIREDDQDNIFDVRDYATWIAELEGNKIRWVNEETDEEYGVYDETRGGEKICDRFMDQAAKGFIAKKDGSKEVSYWDFYKNCDIVCRPAVKSHESGENAIHALLRPRKHEFKGQWPRLHIAASCRELIAEFPNHRYRKRKTISEEADLKQQAREVRTHQLDNLRYIATSNAAFIPSMECGRYEIHNA
jgi:hypothetical protein